MHNNRWVLVSLLQCSVWVHCCPQHFYCLPLTTYSTELHTCVTGHFWELSYSSNCAAGRSLLDIRDLTLRVPSSGATLVQDLTLSVTPGG